MHVYIKHLTLIFIERVPIEEDIYAECFDKMSKVIRYEWTYK